MEKKLVINVNDYETRVALLEDGNIAELLIERRDEATIAGNVYKGKVVRVLPGMQAAFVDIGLHHAAFLHVNDIHNRQQVGFNDIFEGSEALEDEMPPNGEDHGQEEQEQEEIERHIEEYLTEGQEILVQAAKAPLGTKGARVTTHIPSGKVSRSDAHIRQNWRVPKNRR
jgi:ribonuclease G